MNHTDTDIPKQCRELRDAGFALARIPAGQKRATVPGWTTRSEDPDSFRLGDGVGLLTGPLSNANLPGHCLICIDIDSHELANISTAHLPPTGMIDGRPSKPTSHHWYLVPFESITQSDWAADSAASEAATAACGHPGPRRKAFRGGDGEMLVEVLGTGQQAVCPPSQHPSGESRS